MLYIAPYMDDKIEEIDKREFLKLCVDRIKAY